jgi:hypothetical protein
MPIQSSSTAAGSTTALSLSRSPRSEARARQATAHGEYADVRVFESRVGAFFWAVGCLLCSCLLFGTAVVFSRHSDSFFFTNRRAVGADWRATVQRRAAARRRELPQRRRQQRNATTDDFCVFISLTCVSPDRSSIIGRVSLSSTTCVDSVEFSRSCVFSLYFACVCFLLFALIGRGQRERTIAATIATTASTTALVFVRNLLLLFRYVVLNENHCLDGGMPENQQAAFGNANSDKY